MITVLRVPNILLFDDLVLGMTQQVDFSITQQDMVNFAALSGDYNPLHLSDRFAQGKSFKHAIVYGGLLIAKISQLIGMKLPGRDAVWSGINLNFYRPLYIDQPAQVTGSISRLSSSTHSIELELLIQSQGFKLAKGKAEVILVRA